MAYSFVFFKQKTAYEMRISDWSSDVCSSDLATRGNKQHKLLPHVRVVSYSLSSITTKYPNLALKPSQGGPWASTCGCHSFPMSTLEPWAWPAPMPQRSEEHTSELQSLMRISYAVFCLKRKNKHIRQRQLHNANCTQPITATT